MVAGVAVYDVEGLHFREIVFGGISREHARHARVESAAEYGGEARFLETFAVGPLPRIFEVGLVLGLVVGGVEIVHAALQASLHDGEILVGEGDVYHDVGTVAVEQLHELVNGVGIDAVGCHAVGAYGLGHGVAFRLGARGNNNLIEHFGVHGAFVGHYRAHSTGADDKDFIHFLYFVFSCFL